MHGKGKVHGRKGRDGGGGGGEGGGVVAHAHIISTGKICQAPNLPPRASIRVTHYSRRLLRGLKQLEAT
jgi:hypothetical protein